ncbi:MAG: SpoIIE family protein phosphatase [Bacteroidia bacterium]|nr:SpoIIE family protein phosphatase [Bacteroidia bacterium]
MQIRSNGELDGVIFFDHNIPSPDINLTDIQKLIRFKEHAVSAFAKARILRELEDKNHEVETSYRKISDSIRYARRIQRAILPSEDQLKGYFKDYFLVYRPKDIVSGDFYWFAETVPEPIFALEHTGNGHTSVFKGFQDMKAVMAVVDCTGHGVPGAFMTVIGNDLLYSIVMEEKVVRAHQILDKLDRNVRMYLKQEEGNRSQDGMDMSLIVIDEGNHSIEFAGAKNPVYFIRDGVLHQIKGSKHPIGGIQIKNKVFRSHTLSYLPGDVFYLFSDGFTDQFGGKEDRKYGSRRFRELLLETHTLGSMSAQKEALEQELDFWQGANNQTDDILVVGLKF